MACLWTINKEAFLCNKLQIVNGTLLRRAFVRRIYMQQLIIQNFKPTETVISPVNEFTFAP